MSRVQKYPGRVARLVQQALKEGGEDVPYQKILRAVESHCEAVSEHMPKEQRALLVYEQIEKWLPTMVVRVNRDEGNRLEVIRGKMVDGIVYPELGSKEKSGG